VLIEHRGRAPVIDPTAYVAPTAVLCGAVHIVARAHERQVAWLKPHRDDRIVGP
jgi:carbonic anhydrase/acetyltransferase-like protein (isoleucine patch superfamily)